MTKDRFVPHVFPSFELSIADQAELQALVSTLIEEHLPGFREYCHSSVDRNRWKLFKTKENIRVYSEREFKHERLSGKKEEDNVVNLSVLLCEGAISGKFEDVMYGVMSPTLEVMRLNSSYLHDMHSASVLSTLISPSPDDPFQSLVLKWVRLDLPLHSTSLVKNRDFVYVDATGILYLQDGEQLGFHVQHSVKLPHAPHLPGLVRGNFHLCAFFRQERELAVEMYALGACDPRGPVLKSLLVHSIASVLLTSTDYAHCGEMKKLTWIMQHRNKLRMQLSIKCNDDKCVNCALPLRQSRVKRLSTVRRLCKLCFHPVCRSCRVQKLLTFMELDFQYIKRKVTFCPVCIKEALGVCALQVARDETLTTFRVCRTGSMLSTASSSDEEMIETIVRLGGN
ncbi:hypothetical protein PsorP6_017529 [Peronosclerospora sorghi]|uniref:Uncharacterized protein n=1 Tax=Peronosclerospora sorghi TaxID=230839 RepID=A0ACC0WM72_9STRA|nr:hypothetical protein PsorP6_017529 [Peronosclerospora sorghi]